MSDFVVIGAGSGYFADVCVCRPKSRGALTLASRGPATSPNIDLGLFNDRHDLDILVAGLERLQAEFKATDLGPYQVPQAGACTLRQTQGGTCWALVPNP